MPIAYFFGYKKYKSGGAMASPANLIPSPMNTSF
jgi:hypothetical protein